MIYSLIIGRYQPLHKGHIVLIRRVLDEGKNVCIALRDTDISDKNLYSARERIDMFNNEFKKEISKNKLVVILIPDIEEVVYGRDVGWRIRKINLPDKIENISATKIRDNLDKRTK